jgi:MYXO-CTERM domain-containing protein
LAAVQGPQGSEGAAASRPWESADQGALAGLPSNWYFCNGCSSHVQAYLASPAQAPATKVAQPSALALIALALLGAAAMRRRSLLA